MDMETVKKLTKVLDDAKVSADDAAPIMRICAEQMGMTLSVADPKNKNKFKSEFEIKQKYEELNQRMKVQTGNLFGIMDPSTMSIDAQRYALEWVMGQHDEDPTLEDLEKDLKA